MVTKRRLAWPVAVLAIGALVVAGAGCDDDFEEMFDDLDLTIVNPYGGGYGYSPCGGGPFYGGGDCGGGYYYYEEDRWDSWWW